MTPALRWSCVFKPRGAPVQLNFQDRDGFVPPYQARQLVRMIEKYGSNP